MADEVQLPRITSGVDPQVVTVLQQLAQQLGAVAQNTDRTADAAEAQEGAFGKMGERVKAVVGDLRGMAETAGQIVGVISELSAEQGRLDRSSASLGVSFQQAATAAGRYVDQLVIQRAAETAAQTGLRLTQQELDALARRAAQYAQATGTDMTQAVEQLTEAVVKGEQEGLQRFGGSLAEVGRQSGTTGQRLQALVQDANATARATDDASTAAQRLSGELRQAGREASAAFTERLAENIRTLSGELDTSATRAEDLKTTMRALGSIGADTLTMLGGVALGVISLIGTPIAAVIDGVRYLRNAVSGGPTTGDPLESARAMVAANMNALAMIRRGASGIAGGGERTEGEAPRGSDVMEFTLADVQARGRGTGGGGGSSRGGNRGMTAQQLAMAQAEMRAAERAKADEMLSRLMGEATGGDTLDNVMRRESERAANDNAADRKVEDSIKNMERIRTAATEMADVGKMAFNSFGSAFTNAMLAVATGRASFDEAMRAMLQTTLETIAQQAAVESLKNLAIAAGLQATTYGIPNPGSISAGTAAAIWAAVAVAAGAGAAGMAALAPSGGGASAGAGTTPVPERPTPSGREAGGGAGGPTVVNNYYNAPVIDGRSSTRAEVGTELQRGYLDRESRRTQGARRAA